MAKHLNGKVALVTGAGPGIGRVVALASAREGARVVVSDVALEGGEESVHIIGDAGGEAVFVKTDVSSAKEIEALVGGAAEGYGRLDSAINLTGEFLCIKHEMPRMLETGGGSIVNMASVLGLVGFANAPAYTAAKHGVVG